MLFFVRACFRVAPKNRRGRRRTTTTTVFLFLLISLVIYSYIILLKNWRFTNKQTTAVLLDNQEIPGLENMTFDDLYYSTNLALIPDISVVGREYYTLIYELELNNNTFHSAISSPQQQQDSPPPRRTTLRISGINYRASAYLNGEPLSELCSSSSSSNSVNGMFRRRFYDVTPGGLFQIEIEPPLHPGNYSTTTTNNNLGQQGGNHSLAMDGPTAQFFLGWDWCQAMPDRSTGFYGAVLLEDSGPGAILDPSIHTLNVTCNFHSLKNNNNASSDAETTMTMTATTCSSIWITIDAHIECTTNQIGRLWITSDWNETWQFPLVLSSSQGTNVHVSVPVAHPEKVQLWWPHGIGFNNQQEVAHLHSFTFSLEIAVNNEEDENRRRFWISDQRTIDVGIRTIETHLDENLQGQTFSINGFRLYLVGGNWIAPDQALRYSASPERYCQELALHVHAGLNLIRVWGGGMAETDDFYNCADRLGLLVFQEFWM